ncbi:MAG: hypothetical protein RPU64_15080 [Candidatus Sedimenticola sp. (ex Thyasira tokunagai)]
MNKLINLFVNICLLRAAPQDVPASTFLLAVTALLGLATGTLVIHDTFGGLVPAFLAQLLDLVMVYILLSSVLRFLGKSGRLVQTATALFASGTIINLLAMPLQLLIGGDPATSEMGGLGALLYLILMLWGVLIVAHIARHTFEISLRHGLLIAISYFLLVNAVVDSLFLAGAQ